MPRIGSRLDLLIILKVEGQLVHAPGPGAEPRFAMTMQPGLQLLNLVSL